MRILVVVLGIVLFALHQDVWNWTSDRLIFGFMPIGLAYHALYSIAAAMLWAYAIRVAWPKALERWADSKEEERLL